MVPEMVPEPRDWVWEELQLIGLRKWCTDLTERIERFIAAEGDCDIDGLRTELWNKLASFRTCVRAFYRSHQRLINRVLNDGARFLYGLDPDDTDWSIDAGVSNLRRTLVQRVADEQYHLHQSFSTAEQEYDSCFRLIHTYAESLWYARQGSGESCTQVLATRLSEAAQKLDVNPLRAAENRARGRWEALEKESRVVEASFDDQGRIVPSQGYHGKRTTFLSFEEVKPEPGKYVCIPGNMLQLSTFALLCALKE